MDKNGIKNNFEDALSYLTLFQGCILESLFTVSDLHFDLDPDSPLLFLTGIWILLFTLIQIQIQIQPSSSESSFAGPPRIKEEPSRLQDESPRL
jgi:hypothetical protein